MHIHILGISGTFMSALAILAKQKGYRVTGNDTACYPPISDLLKENNIEFIDNYDDKTMMLAADEVIVGNSIKRGMSIIELLLNNRKKYISGPAWLAREVLDDRQVIAIAGTHGKTTVTTMLALILEQAGFSPGYLIGGVPQCLDSSAKLGAGKYFVIEADEYDTAFFDKRPKFIHYRPYGLILHNLEFDHADIYPSLADIQLQVHYLLRTVPQNGWLVRPFVESGIDGAIELGVYSPAFCWSWEENSDARIELIADDGSEFKIKTKFGEAVVKWGLIGQHNVENAVAAILASYQLGVPLQQAADILKDYRAVKRRMEVCFQHQNLSVYDDFAHHPTAIERTTLAIRNTHKHDRVIGIVDFASNSMRAGHHLKNMAKALRYVDEIFILQSEEFDMSAQARNWPCKVNIKSNIDDLVADLLDKTQRKDGIVIMSNKGMGGLKTKLLANLRNEFFSSQS